MTALIPDIHGKGTIKYLKKGALIGRRMLAGINR